MAKEKFHYPTKHGEIVLPRFSNLKTGMMRKVRRMDPADQIFTILEELLSEEGLEIFDKMDGEEMEEFVGAWQANAGVILGESKASSTPKKKPRKK